MIKPQTLLHLQNVPAEELYEIARIFRCRRCGQTIQISINANPADAVHYCYLKPGQLKPSHGGLPEPKLPCIHLGEPTENDYYCAGCSGGTFRTFECLKHAQKETLPFITKEKRINDANSKGFLTCHNCPDRQTPNAGGKEPQI